MKKNILQYKKKNCRDGRRGAALKMVCMLLALMCMLSSCTAMRDLFRTPETASGDQTGFGNIGNTGNGDASGGSGNIGTSGDGSGAVAQTGFDYSFTDRDRDGSYSESGATVVQLSSSGASISGSGAVYADGTVTIKSAGAVILRGSSDGIGIVVAVGKEDKVQLVLDGVTLTSDSGCPLYIKSGDKVFLTLPQGSESRISDGASYAYSGDDSNVDGAIFSRADLTINGSGKLTVTGNYKHGIVSKDDLKIVDCALDVTSKKVALSGKDCVKISGAAISAEAGSDGIRSDNDEDASRGFVYIENSTLSVTATDDGVRSETAMYLLSAALDITAGGGSTGYLSSSDTSCKGIRAGGDMVIDGGTYHISSKDDSIHSDGSITISDGVFLLSSGDDGIHADDTLRISGGEITVAKSYEGLEATTVDISGGRISVTASDDGINGAGGKDGSSFGGRPGMGGFSSSYGEIIISGGYILVNASGDGLDANGTITLTGGVVLVSGPTDNGNGAIDYDTSATVSGGVLIALGSSGMAQGFSSAEGQGTFLVSFSAQSGGTSFAVCDSDGNVIASFTPDKAYQCAAVTAPGITVGESYTVVVGGTVSGADENGYAESGTVSGGTTLGSITAASQASGGMGGGPGGGPGGMGGGPFGGGPGGRR